MTVTIVIAVATFIIGGLVAYLFLKYKKNKKTDEANQLIGESKAKDEKRNDTKQKIQERIKKNNELREKLKDKLK